MKNQFIFIAVSAGLFAVIFLVTIDKVSAVTTNTASPQTQETRCGWFSNPTPGNAWLIDKYGEWTISIQGGYEAQGDWPKTGKWILQNTGSYGYGCTCAVAKTDPNEMKVLEIISSRGRPLSACRRDKSLRGKEPK